MFESRSGIFLVAGLIFFGLSFVSNAVVPILMYRHIPERSVTELVKGNDESDPKLKPNANLLYQFEDLSLRYPEQFAKYFGEVPQENRTQWLQEKCIEVLSLGRDVYVGEACWHCHSQFVRPVSNESARWGPVSQTWEYQNELQRPVLFGTRRIGPDLSREGGRRGSDWHAVHFYQPDSVSPDSPMPDYKWFFDGSPDKPNERGFAIITYVQWLGSWLEEYPDFEDYRPLQDKMDNPLE